MRARIFLTSFLLSLPFWWTTNLLERNLNNVFFWEKISRDPKLLSAQISQHSIPQERKPVKIKAAEALEINAKSALSVFISGKGEEIVLFEKDKERRLPIASITKLMTALVVLENYDLSKEVKISEKAVAQKELLGQLQAGKVFSVKYLLYPLLMESSNDSAFALANDYDGMTEEKFIEKMNETAKRLNLQNTFFANVSGLDPEPPETKINYSTASDLALLAKELLKHPLIWQILSTKSYSSFGPELTNINALLFDENFKQRPKMLGGKTGYTDSAGGCMALVVLAPRSSGQIVNIVLGAKDSQARFEEIKKLVNWTDSAYRW